jgi:iron(III) transport system substrate-binding protein
MQTRVLRGFHKVLFLVAGLVLVSVAMARGAAPTPTASTPAVTSATTLKPWKAKWEEVLKAARQEGRVVIYAGPGDDRRRALTEAFETAYPGIKVEYLGLNFGDLAARLASELRAGTVQADVFFGGTGSMYNLLRPLRAWDPLEPYLVRPEVADPSNWQGGMHSFTDPERAMYEYSSIISGGVTINTSRMSPKNVPDHMGLLNPRWKGRLASISPLFPGSGQGSFTGFWLKPKLGPEFIRGLREQQLVFASDYAQGVDWILHGVYDILLGAPSDITAELARQGAPVHYFVPDGYGSASVGGGVVARVKGGPHANAATVYINWLLGPEAQERINKIIVQASRRADVSASYLDASAVPQPGRTYVRIDDPKALSIRPEMMKLVKSLWR